MLSFSGSELRFEFFRFRFHFRALQPVYFPAGKAGNVVRGAFGTLFRKIACVPDCRGAAACEVWSSCPYRRIFKPGPEGAPGPSGLVDWPRSFVFRAGYLDGRVIESGESFHFDLHSFDTQDPTLRYFVLTFVQLAREGIGHRRGRAELVSVEQLDLEGRVAGKIFDGQTFLLEKSLPPASVELDARGEPVSRAHVRFLTPTELKSGQELAPRPEFAILFARLRDRISTLRALYGAGPLEIDFRMTAERAARVRMPHCSLRWTAAERRSARTGRVHPLGGFVGEADYEGDLTEFMPYLQVARWTGVGRQTVWGKGEVQVYS